MTSRYSMIITTAALSTLLITGKYQIFKRLLLIKVFVDKKNKMLEKETLSNLRITVICIKYNS